MDTKQQYRDKFWAFVTVFGTLWGGLELTLGTFLHVLHVPKTGFIMVALSAILLVAQRQIFPARWSTLAAGVIAACIKSLSPGGIIAGPIFGILSEALIIELCLMAAPRNLVLSICAGSMALLWSQLQSVFKMWIYYGSDFIASLIKVIEKFLKIQWTAAIGWSVVGVLLLIILGTGAVAGITGYRLGRHVRREIELKQQHAPEPEIAGAESDESPVSNEKPAISANENPAEILASMPKLQKKRNSENNAQAVKTRLWLLPFAIVTLVAQFGDSLWLALGASVIWAIALAIGARCVLKAVWWPKFWLFTFAISCICGVILAWQFGGSWDWELGAMAAIRMFVRGFYVFSLVSWATRCVRAEEFLNVWKRLHLPRFGHAITHAYTLLPQWLDRMNTLLASRPKGFMRNIRYIRQCSLLCLVEATEQTESLQQTEIREPEA